MIRKFYLYLSLLTVCESFRKLRTSLSNRNPISDSSRGIISFEEIELFAKNNGIVLKSEENAISLRLDAFAVGDEMNRIG